MSGPRDLAGRSALAQAAALLAAGSASGDAVRGHRAATGRQLHVSVQHALQAWGVPAAQAQAMAKAARLAADQLVRVPLAPCEALATGGELLVQRMPGNHAEAWVVPAGAAALPKENN